MCSPWVTEVSSSQCEKGIPEQFSLTSNRNRPITLEKVQHMGLTPGPYRNFSSRSYKKTDYAGRKVGFSDGLSWPARSFRHLSTALWVCWARNACPLWAELPRSTFSIMWTPPLLLWPFCRQLVLFYFLSSWSYQFNPAFSYFPSSASWTWLSKLNRLFFLHGGASTNCLASLQSPCAYLWPSPGPTPVASDPSCQSPSG